MCAWIWSCPTDAGSGDVQVTTDDKAQESAKAVRLRTGRLGLVFLRGG